MCRRSKFKKLNWTVNVDVLSTISWPLFFQFVRLKKNISNI